MAAAIYTYWIFALPACVFNFFFLFFFTVEYSSWVASYAIQRVIVDHISIPIRILGKIDASAGEVTSSEEANYTCCQRSK
jgi:hypothetical protein